MNWSQGFHAVGQGMQLLAEREGKREDQDWQAMKAENMARLQHGFQVEEEAIRADNVHQENDAQRRFTSTENRRRERADDARQNRADERADARLTRQERGDSVKALAELRRHRTSTLQNFRTQYGKALEDYSRAKSSGMADEQDLAELRSNIQYIQQEMMDFDAQSKDALAVAGDSWAKKQLLSDGDFSDFSKPAKGLSNLSTPSLADPGAPVPKSKPLQARPMADAAAPPRTLEQVEAEIAQLKPMADRYGVDADTPELYSAWARRTTLENEAKDLRKARQRAEMQDLIKNQRADDRMLPSSF